jgi:uncharacterized protein (TIGR01777 family)
MNLFMTGGTGFVGASLAAAFAREGHQVTILTPALTGRELQAPGVTYLAGDPKRQGEWQQAVPGQEAIINLAGASIFSRWTEAQKRLLRSSRLDTTRHLVEALPPDARGITFLSTSAVGYYGFQEDEVLTEAAPRGTDFLATLAADWEAEALRAQERGARVLITRFGIVLGQNGGALGQMVPLYRRFLGGPQGTGRQWFSWVHLEDLVRAFAFLLTRPEMSGAVNVCSPCPVRNRALGKAIGKVLRRPSLLPAPAFMIRWILGEFGSVLLKGQRGIPRRLLDAGVQFQYPEIEAALRQILVR